MVLQGQTKKLFEVRLQDILGNSVADNVQLVYTSKRPSCASMKERCVEHCEAIG